MHAAYVTPVHYNINICTQPTSAVILFLAKSDKIFHYPIMAEQLPCFQRGFDILNFENSDHIYFIKEIKTCSKSLRSVLKNSRVLM